MFPLYDESTGISRLPIVTILLIFFNVLFFLISLPSLEETISNYGLLPKDILEGRNLGTLFSSMFLHGGFLHLLGNMWFLWIFGDNLEVSLGRFRLLAFYLICGMIASLSFALIVAEKTIPLIGASGAISGILGGYARLHPRNKIRTLVFLGFLLMPVSVPAIVFLFIWLLYQILIPLPGIATLAHIIGFLAGFLLVKSFR